MAKEKKEGKKAKPSLLDDVDLAIESPIQMQQLTLKGGYWSLKFTVAEVLSEMHQHYRALMSYDEQPERDQIEAINRDLKDGLFKDDPLAAGNAKKSIGRIEKEMDKKRELCDEIEFFGTVLEVKFVDAGTQIVMQIPDKIIELLNKQKGRIKLYKIRLEPAAV